MANNDVQCPLTEEELQKWHAVLLTKRQEITEEINGLIRDAIDVEDGHTTPTHNADRGSDADMQDISLGMVGNEEELLWQIDRALQKIEKASHALWRTHAKAYSEKTPATAAVDPALGRSC